MTTEAGRTFEDVPHLYHRMRPRYPSEFFDRIGAHLPPKPEMLEVGSGTGIATAPMLERGWRLTCLEPGAAMIDVARETLPADPPVHFIEGTFETADLAPGSFDGIASATAFHWTDPHTRYERSARLLRDGGILAVIHYRHIYGGDVELFAELQGHYARFMPDHPESHEFNLPPQGSRTRTERDMRRSGHFAIVDSAWQVVEDRYTTSEYLDLLRTYSTHRMLSEADRDGLLTAIADSIERAGGSIVKAHQHELVIGQRLNAPAG